MTNKSLEWHRRRQLGITGTDIGAICGLSPYKTPMDVYNDKIGLGEATQQKLSAPMYWGQQLEGIVACEYQERLDAVDNTYTMIEVTQEFTIEGNEPNFNVIKETCAYDECNCGSSWVILYQHKEHEFMIGSPDRIIGTYNGLFTQDQKDHLYDLSFKPISIKDPYILECKTASSYTKDQWGEEGTDQIPAAYLAQVAWYTAICDMPKADIAVLIGGNDYRIYTYLRDKEFENKLIKIGHNFWHNNVLKRVPPKASNAKEMLTIYPHGNNSIRANKNIDSTIFYLQTLKRLTKENEVEFNKNRLKVQEYMGEHDVLLDENDHVLVTWKNAKTKDGSIKRLFYLRSSIE